MCRGDAETGHSVPLKLLTTSLCTHWFLLESCTVRMVIVLVPLSLMCVSAGFLLIRHKFPFSKFLSERFTSPRFMQWVVILCIRSIYSDAQVFLIWPVEPLRAGSSFLCLCHSLGPSLVTGSPGSWAEPFSVSLESDEDSVSLPSGRRLTLRGLPTSPHPHHVPPHGTGFSSKDT